MTNTTTNSRFFKFKMPDKDLTIDRTLHILKAHFQEDNGNIWILQITKTKRSANIESVRTFLTGCGTHDYDLELSNSVSESQDIVYKFEFPIEPIDQGDTGLINLYENRNPFLSLSSKECTSSKGSNWFKSSEWYSGSLSFPDKQEVMSVYMAKEEKDYGKR